MDWQLPQDLPSLLQSPPHLTSAEHRSWCVYCPAFAFYASLTSTNCLTLVDTWVCHLSLPLNFVHIQTDDTWIQFFKNWTKVDGTVSRGEDGYMVLCNWFNCFTFRNLQWCSIDTEMWLILFGTYGLRPFCVTKKWQFFRSPTEMKSFLAKNSNYFID